jgi:hypothetical protein
MSAPLSFAAADDKDAQEKEDEYKATDDDTNFCAECERTSWRGRVGWDAAVNRDGYVD